MQILGAPLNHLPLRVADAMAWSTERRIFGDLAPYGLPRPPVGAATQLEKNQQAPACDDGFVDALKAGRVTVVAAVEGFDGADILLADGSRIHADSVIAATGYHRGLGPLVGHLGVLDDRDTPLAHGKPLPNAPGLYFAGYRGDLSGQLRLMKFHARSIARAFTSAR
jgi:putative flavoprotein involved in K+ transport